MTTQQHADLLLSQWQALWSLSPAERIKLIDEIRIEGEFEEQLKAVKREVERK